MEKYVFWVSLIVGLLTFGGFSIAIASLIKSTPNALRALRVDVANLLALIENEGKQKRELVQQGIDEIEEIKDCVEKIQKQVHDLKYQHDHADNFKFGTKRTNELLQDVSNRLVRIEVKLGLS
jgi:hypothetical protein